MRLIAKFVKKLDPVFGETEKGSWSRGGFIVRTIDDREQLVAFTAYGAERILLYSALKTDDIVEVVFVPESREFNDKWYTDLRMLNVALVGNAVNRKEGV
jgi:hypothetical protein